MKVRGLNHEAVDVLVHDFDVAMRESMKKALALAMNVSVVAATQGPEQAASTFGIFDDVAGIQVAWAHQVSTELGPALGQVFFLAGNFIHDQVAKALPDDPNVASAKMTIGNTEAFLHDAITRVNGFSTELWEMAKTQVTLGLQDGESMAQISQRIEDVAQIKAAKAKVIAQTTVIGAVNGGEYEQMLSLTDALGVAATKQWEATEDSHTRPTHAVADGQIVALTERFNVGDSMLRFPGDPTGQPSEIISCRCVTLYDIDVEDAHDDLQASVGPNHWASWTTELSPHLNPYAGHFYWPQEDVQSIPGTPSSQPAVTTNGSPEDTLTAAFRESDHPRGKDGKFIKKGVGLPGVILDVLKTLKHYGDDHDLITGGEKVDAVTDIPHITSKQWANLKDEDKAHLQKLAEDALDEGVPGSAAALTHLDDLEQGGAQDETPDVFNPETTLPTSSKVTSWSDQTSKNYTTGDVVAEQEIIKDHKLQLVKLNPGQNEQYDYVVNAQNPTTGEWSPADYFSKKQIADGELKSEYPGDWVGVEPGTKSVTPDVPDVAKFKMLDTKIKQMLNDGDITKEQYDKLVIDLHDSKLDKVQQDIANLTTSAPTPPTTTIAKATPVKITHGLIHAKHTPGEIIAQTKFDGKQHRIKWNGKEYEAQIQNGGSWQTHQILKKSGTYAWLAKNFPNAAWTKPGKQDIEVDASSINAPKSPKNMDYAVGHSQLLSALLAGKFHSGSGDLIDIDQSAKAIQGITQDEWDKLTSEQRDFITNTLTQAQVSATPKVHLATFHVDELKAKQVSLTPPSTPKVAQKLDMTGWKQVGAQGGSNLGGLFEAPDGTRYYVKSLKSPEHAKSEVLAAGLYQAAGIEVPEVRHVASGTGPTGWDNIIASKIVEGKSASSKLQSNPTFQGQVSAGFAVDAWLANWDTVGLAYDNVKDVNGKPVRIDVGGSLEYRAQGGKKLFGSDVPELSTLKNPGMNSQAAKVFGGMTPEQEKASAKQLLGVTDAQIDQMVADAGMPSSLATTLKARRNFILAKYNLDAQNNSTSNVPMDMTDTQNVDVDVPSAKVSPALIPAGSPAPAHIGLSFVELEEQFNTKIQDEINNGLYSTGDVVATGTSSKYPNAEYRVVVDGIGLPEYQYKTPNFDWKVNQTPASFDKVDVKWTVNPPSKSTPAPVPTPSVTEKDQDDAALLNLWNKGLITSEEYTQQTGLPAPNASTPTTTSSTIPHASEDVISNWPGVIPTSHTPGETVAFSIDGKYTLVEGNTPTWFYLKDASGDHLASYTAHDVKKGNVSTDTGNVDWVISPSPALGATPTLNTPAPSTGIGHLNAGQKAQFYAHFKAEKVSPAWSGAKIYNSIQVAKMKMAGDSTMASLTDEQMLQIVDEQNWLLKSGNPKNAYSTKVVDWLKTPNGKKAALAAKSGGWASGHASVSGMPSTLPPVYGAAAKKIVKKAAAAAAAKKLTVANVFGPSPDLTPDISNVSSAEQTATFSVFKSSTIGQFFKHKPEEIFWNAVQAGKTKGYSPAQVLALVDAETAKKNGFINNNAYVNKVKDWLNTLTGQKKAYEIQQGTWSPSTAPAKKAAKKAYAYGGTTYGSSYGGSYDFDANTPYAQKVAQVGDKIESFDSSKGPSDFPVLSTTQAAAMWENTKKIHGEPTASEKASLKYYTSNAGYTAMNGYMRGKMGATTATQNHINKAQSGMKPITQPITLHRGAGWFTGWSSYAEIKANEGKVWQEPAFFSASVGGKSAFGGSIGYIIEVPEGTPGALVLGKASNYGNEKELFLAAGLKYQIISVENKGTSTTSGSQVTVRLRVVPDDTPSYNVVASASMGGVKS